MLLLFGVLILVLTIELRYTVINQGLIVADSGKIMAASEVQRLSNPIL